MRKEESRVLARWLEAGSGSTGYAWTDGTDFDDFWKGMTQRQIAHRAWEVINEAKLHLGIEIRRVVVTTDETDSAWL